MIFRFHDRKLRKKNFRLNLDKSFAKPVKNQVSYQNQTAESQYELQQKELVLSPIEYHKKMKYHKKEFPSNRNFEGDLRDTYVENKEEMLGLTVGETVIISGQESGVIRYLGKTHFQVIENSNPNN